MRTTLLTILAAASLTLAIAACSPPVGAGAKDKAGGGPKQDLAAAVGKNVYRNEQFGLTITAPEGWYVADSEVTKQLMEVGADVSLANQSAAKRDALKASVQRSTNIFSFFRHPPGTPTESNPGLLGMAENVGMEPGITSGRDYFFHARKVLEMGAVPTKIAPDYNQRTIGGQKFDRMDVVMGEASQAIQERYFAARHGASMVVLIEAYRTDEELAELDRVLDSIKLDW